MKRFLLGLAILAFGLPVKALTQDDRNTASGMFREAYRIQTRADQARDGLKLDDAIVLYEAARDQYLKLVRRFPDWLPGDTAFRVGYCENQVRALRNRQRLAGGPAAGGPARAAPDAAAGPGAAPPADLAAVVTASSVFLKQHDVDRARATLLKGMERDPDNREVRLLMGVAQCEAGRFRDASMIARQLLEEDDADAYAHVLLGTSYFGLGLLAEAAGALRRAVELDPAMPEPHANLAHVLLLLEPADRQAASNHYREGLKRGAPPDRDLERHLASGSESGRTDKAPPPALREQPAPAADGGPVVDMPEEGDPSADSARKPWFRRFWPWGGPPRDEPAQP